MEPKVRRRSSKLPKLRIYARIYTLFCNTNKAPSTCLRNSPPENVFAGSSQRMSSRVALSKCLRGSLPANFFPGRLQQMSLRVAPNRCLLGPFQQMSSRAVPRKCLRGPLAANVFASCQQQMSSLVAPANVFAGRLQQVYSLDISATRTRTRVARVRAEYPNQLDYSGSRKYPNWACSIIFPIEPTMAKLGA